jgi:hypothetical protein
MNDYAKRWVAELRSGKYKQCKSYLATEVTKGEPRYCCLGVACEILKDELDLAVEEQQNCKSYDKTWTSLPNKVMDALDIRNSMGGFIDENGSKRCLVNLNDYEGNTFAEIADVIESEPEGLFNE